jgi:hypothetical protein
MVYLYKGLKLRVKITIFSDETPCTLIDVWKRFEGIYVHVKLGLNSIKCNNVFSNKMKLLHVGFEDLTAVVMKSTIFWDITPCSPLSVNWRFGGTYRLHLQGRRNKYSKKRAKKILLTTCLLFKPLHVSANEGHHQKATNTSKKMLLMYYIHVVSYGLH